MKKALVIRFSSIGDIILTTPAIRALKRINPDKKVDFLTKEEYSTLLEGHPDISNVISFNKMLSLFVLRRKIKREYDLVLDLHSNNRSLFLTSFLKNVKVFRTKRYDILRHVSAFVKTRFLLKNLPSVPDRHLFALKSIGAVDDGKGLDYPLREGDIKTAERVLAEKQFKDNDFIVLAPGAKWNTKRWRVENFREIVESLPNKRFVIIGGSEDIDRGKLISSRIEERVLDLCGKVSIDVSAAIVSKASLVVSNDSSAVHIASAFKKAVIVIYASTVPEFGFTPYKTKNRILKATIGCSPCTTTGREKCPRFNRPECLEEISVGEVLRNIALISINYESGNK